LLKKGCYGYLCVVDVTPSQEREVRNILIVSKFPGVFQEVPRLPLDREIEFTIHLMPVPTLICKTPYRMAPTNLAELKTQFQELLDKGLIQPSVSPWGGLVLFVKKKDGSLRLCIRN